MEANPEQQVVTTMQVHQGDQPRLQRSCIASLACVCMMAACPLHKQKTNKRRSFTSLQMSHTHPAKAGCHFWKNIAVLHVDARIVVNLRNCDLQGCCQSIQKLSSKLAAELGSRRGSSCVPPFSMGR